VCVFKVTSPDSERYGQWETERACVCSKDHNRWFFAGSSRKVSKYSRILLFCLFCQPRGGPARAKGGARAGKDRAGGSSTGALCTRFTHTCALGTGHTLVWYKSEMLQRICWGTHMEHSGNQGKMKKSKAL